MLLAPFSFCFLACRHRRDHDAHLLHPSQDVLQYPRTTTQAHPRHPRRTQPEHPSTRSTRWRTLDCCTRRRRCSRLRLSYSDSAEIAATCRLLLPRCRSSIHSGTAQPALRMQSAIAWSRGASSSTKNVTASPRRPARPVRPTLHPTHLLNPYPNRTTPPPTAAATKHSCNPLPRASRSTRCLCHGLDAPDRHAAGSCSARPEIVVRCRPAGRAARPPHACHTAMPPRVGHGRACVLPHRPISRTPQRVQRGLGAGRCGSAQRAGTLPTRRRVTCGHRVADTAAGTPAARTRLATPVATIARRPVMCAPRLGGLSMTTRDT